MTGADESQVNEKAPAGSINKAVENNHGASDLPVASPTADKLSLITINEAQQKISAEILSVLADKFKGKLSEVRPLDEKDILF